MSKDFDSWNKLKKRVNYAFRERDRAKEREIWWCLIGHNIGSEQDGSYERFERPVIILKRFNEKWC